MTSRSNPYAGPAALVEGASIYGRSAEIEELADLLISARLVLLYSPSGAGKTSLIQAGLLKALRNELRFSVTFMKGFGGGQDKNNRYLGNLYEVLDDPLPENRRMPPSSPSESLSLDDYLRNRPTVLQEGPQVRLNEETTAIPTFDDLEMPLDAARDATDETAGHVLIFDQFEEIFTLDPFDRDKKAEFFRQVGAALKDRTRCALFSMREDYIAELDDYLHLLPTQLKARYRLGLLDRSHAREAIEGPALEQGVAYESGAADLLVNELCKVRRQTARGNYEEFNGNFVEPVQLQVVCHRLWEHLYPADVRDKKAAPSDIVQNGVSDTSRDRISQIEVRNLSVDSALEQFYEEKVNAAALAASVSAGDIRSWFERELITPHGIRGQVLWEPERSGGLSNQAIEYLENHHLVRMEARGDRKWFELAHDRLINPIRSSNSAWSKQLAPLQRATLEWDAQERRQDIFLSPLAWVNAWIWTRLHRDMVRQSELDFLTHSRRSILQNQGLILILMTVIGIFIFLLYLAYTTRIKLEQSEERLKISSAAYRAQIDASQRTMNTALLSTAQVAKKYQDLLHQEASPQLSTTMRETLFTTLHHAADIRRIFVGNNTVLRAIAFIPSVDGEPLFAYAGEEGAIVLAGVDSGFLGKIESVCFDEESKKNGAVYSLAFNHSGTRLAVGCESGHVAVWDTSAGKAISTWQKRSRWRAHKGTWAVAINPAGTQVASGGLDRDIKLMRLAPNGEKLTDDPAQLILKTPLEPGPVAAILSLAFSPSENKLVAGDSKQFLWLCNTEKAGKCARTSVLQAPDNEDRTWAVAFSPNGNYIVTGHSSGRLLRWDVQPAIQNPQSLIAMPRPAPIYSVAVFHKKSYGSRQDAAYVAFGADGLHQTALIPSASHRNVQSQPPIISPDEVYAVSFHAATGMLAAATRSGYVAVTATEGSVNHVASRYSIGRGNSSACSSRSDLAGKSVPGALIEEAGKPARLIIASCGNLQLVEIAGPAPGKARIQQSIPAERIGQGLIAGVAAAPVRKRIATLGEDHTIRFWKLGAELTQDKALSPLGLEAFRDAGFAPKSIQKIILSADGKWLIATFQDSGRLFLLELKTSRNRKGMAIRTTFKRINAITFSPDGKSMAMAGALPEQAEKAPDQVELWSFHDGKPSRDNKNMVLPPLAETASDIVMATTGSGKQIVAVGTSQGHVAIWEAETGKLLQQLQADSTDAVYRLAAAPAQQLIAAVDVRGKITLWNMHSAERLVLTNRLARLQKAELLGFILGGNVLVSADSVLTLWDLDISSLHKKVCEIIGGTRSAGNSAASAEIREACQG